MCKRTRDTMESEQTIQQGQTIDETSVNETPVNETPVSEDITTDSDTKSRYMFQSYSYSRKVVDGKIVEKKKGVKQVDDKWFVLKDDDSWEVCSKQQALTPSSIIKTLEPPKKKKTSVSDESSSENADLKTIEETPKNDIAPNSKENKEIHQEKCKCHCSRNNNALLPVILLPSLSRHPRPLMGSRVGFADPMSLFDFFFM